MDRQPDQGRETLVDNVEFAGPAITHELTSFDGFALGDLDADQRAALLMRGTGIPPRIEARLFENVELLIRDVTPGAT